MRGARRVRGLLIRLVLNRPVAVAAGAIIATPGVLLLMGDYRWESGVTDGVALLTLATGVALAWAGLSGRQPDWVD
jgi:hypothetical protein